MAQHPPKTPQEIRIAIYSRAANFHNNSNAKKSKKEMEQNVKVAACVTTP